MFQALFRKGRELGIVIGNNRTKNYQGHKLLKQFIALAYLPKGVIPSAFRHLRDKTSNAFPDSEPWSQFLRYYEKEWIKNLHFSVYSLVDRTNTYTELYHSRINELVGKNIGWRNFIS